jgi:hypothetical protein
VTSRAVECTVLSAQLFARRRKNPLRQRTLQPPSGSQRKPAANPCRSQGRA